MMKAVWKYLIEEAQDKFEIKMPVGAEILCVQDGGYRASNRR